MKTAEILRSPRNNRGCLSIAVLVSLLFSACDLVEVPSLSLDNPLDLEASEEKGMETPALVFFPDSVSVNVGLSISTKVYAMEVDDVGMAYVRVEYDQDLLSVTSVTAGEFFEGSQDPIFFYEDDADSSFIDINTSFLGPDSTSVSGTGSLASITFSTKAAGKSTLLFSPESLLLDPDSNPLEIKGFGEGVIDAK